MPVIDPTDPRAHPHILGRMYLYVFVPPTVFSAQADGDHTYEFPIKYKNAVGDFNDVYRGQTLLVGTAAGARDKGIIRIRAVDDTANPGAANEYPGATATHIYTSEHEIDIDDNDYLTVLNEFRLWHVDPYITDTGNIYKDWNGTDPNGLIDFPPPAILGGTDRDCENVYHPVPVMGPHSIEWLAAGPLATHDYDWGESWTVNPCVADDTDIDYYAVFPGGNPANSVLESGTVTWATAGARWVRLWVEDDRGIRCYWGHRLYVTLDPDWTDTEARAAGLYVDFQPSPRSGSVDQGGHSMQFTIQVDATEEEFPDGALVMWFFSGPSVTQGDISGNWPHRSHIHFIGHIKRASTHKEPETGYVTFEAETIQGWMKNLPEFPNFLEDISAICDNGDPCANWTEWTMAGNLTVQRAVCLHARWQSSLLEVADVIFIPEGGTIIGEHEFAEGELYQQLDGLVNRDILYRIGCDPLSTVYFNKDPQLLPRPAPGSPPAGIVTIMDIEDEDWQGELDLPEPLEPQTAYILASGNCYTVAALDPYFSEAPGPVPLETGSRESQGRIICTPVGVGPQVTLNIINGLMLAWRNNDFPDIPVPLDGQYYIGHLFPMEFVGLDLGVGDTKRGVSWTAMLFIPRRSRLQVVYDEHGAVSHGLVNLNVERLTYGPPGQTLLYPGMPEPEDPGAPPESPPDPSGDEGDGELVYFTDGTSGRLFRTRNALEAVSGAVDYEDLGVVHADGLNYIALDSWDPSQTAMVVTADGAGGDAGDYLRKTTNLNNAIPDWTTVLDLSGSDDTVSMVVSSICQKGLWMCCGSQNTDQKSIWVRVSTTGGGLGSWTRYDLTDIPLTALERVKIEASSHNANKSWITWVNVGGTPTARISYTATLWVGFTEINYGAASYQANPYHRYSGNPTDQHAVWIRSAAADGLVHVCVADVVSCSNYGVADAATPLWQGGYTWGTNRYWLLADDITNEGFWVSDDAAVWTRQETFAGNVQYASGFPYDYELFYATQDGAVAPMLVSRDRGATWQAQDGDWGGFGYTGDITCIVAVWIEV